jgi:hypothetical protein
MTPRAARRKHWQDGSLKFGGARFVGILTKGGRAAHDQYSGKPSKHAAPPMDIVCQTLKGARYS